MIGAPQKCPRCDGVELWNVRGMQFSEGTLIGSAEGVAQLDTLVCARCGYTRWYAGAPQSIERFGEPCGKCEMTPSRLLQWNAHAFELRVCRRCAACDWRSVRAGWMWIGEHSREEELCLECAHPSYRVEPLRESGFHPLPVALLDFAPVGHFRLLVCSWCDRCEWFARKLDELTSDGEHIFLVRAETEFEPLPSHGGPYR